MIYKDNNLEHFLVSQSVIPNVIVYCNLNILLFNLSHIQLSTAFKYAVEVQSISIFNHDLAVILAAIQKIASTVLPAKSDSDFMFCSQSYQGIIIDILLVY